MTGNDDNNQGGGQEKKPEYVVTVDFTDSKGRAWTVGTVYDGDLLQEALDNGHVAPRDQA